MRNPILYLLFFFIPIAAYAQTPHPWELGGGAGVSIYEGDINETKSNFEFFGTKPSFALHLRRNLSNNFSARLNLLYAGLSGDDKNFEEPAWRQIRAISFQSNLFELSANGEIYPFGLYKKRGDEGGLSNTRRAVAPFFSIGVGALFAKANVDWNDVSGNGEINPGLSQIDKDTPKKFALSIPVGGGIRFRLTDHFTLGLEGALRPTLSDYLDGVSEAGNPEANDWFFTAQIAASYAFGEAKKRSRNYSQPSNADDKIPNADRDGDDVTDDRDDCPDVPGLRSLKGCPDADRDGIADKIDLCPDAAGTLALNGCPDSDGDGIADKEDNCPEVKGVSAYRGCPAIDRDKDGVADAEDLCPDMAGQLKWKGCPDSDGDGLADNKDGCPGIAGPETLRGCPDTDGDGIADKDDECPTMAGKPEKKGCPEALPPAPGVPYKAIYFGSTLPDYHNTSITTLDEAAAILKADPTLFARVEGHTDDTGEEPANDLLSEKRAKKCRDQLVERGISASRLNVVGFGSKRPVVPNDTPANRQLNRRVEIHFYKK